MNEAGEPLPAGLSGMPGPSSGGPQPVEGVEGRVGEVTARVAERGANRSGTAVADPAKGRRMRIAVPARRKVDSEG